MIIRRMTANYGRLQNETMELSEGLNIIPSANETGKSTWCSFIKNMIYGVDSSAREKSGIKPDKVKFAPWSGAPMSGSMELDVGGREISISRSGKDSAPMRELSAVLTHTSEPVKSLTNALGEGLLGISKEVFERSAYIGQNAVAVASTPELEKRISAIVQTGDETESYTDAERKLRDAMRKRRHNKSGRLPEIEREVLEIRERLIDINAEKQLFERLGQAKTQAISRRDTLTTKLAESRGEVRKNTLENMETIRGEVKVAEETVQTAVLDFARSEQAVKSGIFADTELETCKKQVAEDMKSLNELKNKALSSGKNKAIIAVVVFVILAVLTEILAGVGILTADFPVNILRFGFGILATASMVLVIISLRKMRVAGELGEEILRKYNCKTADEIPILLNEYETTLKALKTAENAKNVAEQRLRKLRDNQVHMESNMLRELDFSTGDVANFTSQLNTASAELSRIREQLAQSEGRQNALGGLEELTAALDKLYDEHKNLTIQYEAFGIAAETLKEAGAEIQNRLTPKLSRRASEIFKRLTDGRYDGISLDRELKAMTKLADEPLSRESAFLSVGALDQVYLAVRLAICEFALNEDKPAPLILDDALANFDDERCALALKLLHEISQKRQVLLFTCHGREEQIAGAWEKVNVVVR